ncbi:MAG: rhodanese-like domain-containing protein [Rhodospirillaceae bacterium]|nr:rhodanese-like domain-containing protein [Rhodospirillaceae bacterium]
MPEMVEVPPHTVKEWLELGLAMLIDVREHQELAQFAISGAVHNPMSSFDFDSVPSESDKKLVFVCAHGMRSRQVGQYLLQENRISEAYNLTGGVAAWAQAGLPNQT